jgi:uncharacterized protein (TIGR02452 family)
MKKSVTDPARLKNIEVFEDTKAICREKYWVKVKTQELRNWGPVVTGKGAPTIEVIDGDCVEVAHLLSQKGKTCMLNMANAWNPGGGVARGARAQEEELCRRSNLIYGLKKKLYPLGETDFLYHKNVRFFKDKYYNENEYYTFKCDIITIAAPCLINGPIPNYHGILDNKVKQMLYYPASQGAKNLVLSAFGCGAFRNNPIWVSRVFKKFIKDLPYENISFAIYDDHNAKANKISNLQSFQNTFEV